MVIHVRTSVTAPFAEFSAFCVVEAKLPRALLQVLRFGGFRIDWIQDFN